MAAALIGYGEALAQVGRGDEAQPHFDEALGIARQLNNPTTIAQVYYAEGDVASYRGDFKAGRPFYEQALQSATKAKDAEQILLARNALARNDVQRGNGAAAVATLRSLAAQAESQGLRYESLRCHLDLAEALILTKALAPARTELERTLTQTEKLGLKSLQARAESLLGNDLRLSGNDSLAADHYRRALQLLNDIQKEAGDSRIMKRADFAAIAEQAKQ
jgi:tetratricopeptide (TPR) repeat protein